MRLGHAKRMAKFQVPAPGDEKLRDQLADLLTSQKKLCHASTTPVSME